MEIFNLCYGSFTHAGTRRSDDLMNRDGDEDKFSLTTTSTSPQESTASTDYSRDRLHTFEGRALQRAGGGRTFSYRKKKTCPANGIFSAPPGVSPHHVASSIVRRTAGGSRLVFIWPQKARSRSRVMTILTPLMRGILICLLCINAIHLWPGEFLPTSLPSSTPIPLPPVKCNVIEPRWFDNT